MMKKLQRMGRTIVLVALPMLIVFTIINMYLLTLFHRSHSDTMFILNEKVYKKNSDSSSRVAMEYPRARYSRDDNSIVDRNVDDGVKELNKKSGHEDQATPVEAEIHSVKDTFVEMRDDSIDSMIRKLKIVNAGYFFPSYFWNETMYELTRRQGGIARKYAKTLEGYNEIKT